MRITGEIDDLCTQDSQQYPNRRYKSKFHMIVNYHYRTKFF